MINRRVTRVVLNTTEITDFLTKPNGPNYVPVLTVADSLYIGFHGKFAARFIQIGTVANALTSTLSVEYWNGSAWAAVDDLIDQTSVGGKTLARSGFISWVNKADWKASIRADIDPDVSLFWVRLKVSADLTATAALSSVLNTFCDDNLLRAYFPELITDPAYLPKNQTNFLDQYIAAKDLVVLRLKQRKEIEQESQIIDINDVAIAATYASAMLILQSIATSEDVEKLLAIATKGFNNELDEIDFSVDENEDGIVSDPERTQSTSVWVSRR